MHKNWNAGGKGLCACRQAFAERSLYRWPPVSLAERICSSATEESVPWCHEVYLRMRAEKSDPLIVFAMLQWVSRA
jgi:hypothetical protein